MHRSLCMYTLTPQNVKTPNAGKDEKKNDMFGVFGIYLALPQSLFVQENWSNPPIGRRSAPAWHASPRRPCGILTSNPKRCVT